MSNNRRPRLTPKVCRGMMLIFTNIEASELDFTTTGKKREELDAGMRYITDLALWYEAKKQREKEEKQRRDTLSRVLSAVQAKENKESHNE